MNALSTAELAAAAGYSVQQVRDLEQLGVIPAAERAPNGYRRFTDAHLAALRTYRRLALAIDPVTARGTLREVRLLPLDEAVAAINDLHTGLAAERAEALSARRALLLISAEDPADGERADGDPAEGDPAEGDPVCTDDTMSITALATALGVRTSTLRFWEREGLIRPDRVTRHAVRSYPPTAIREARITVALRAAGYRIPEVRAALEAVHQWGATEQPLDALQDRLDAIAQRTLALLAAGADLADGLTERDAKS